MVTFSLSLSLSLSLSIYSLYLSILSLSHTPIQRPLSGPHLLLVSPSTSDQMLSRIHPKPGREFLLIHREFGPHKPRQTQPGSFPEDTRSRRGPGCILLREYPVVRRTVLWARPALPEPFGVSWSTPQRLKLCRRVWGFPHTRPIRGRSRPSMYGEARRAWTRSNPGSRPRVRWL